MQKKMSCTLVASGTIINMKINIKLGDRRDGDIGKSYADTSQAFKQLQWKAIYNLKDMCKDTWEANS